LTSPSGSPESLVRHTRGYVNQVYSLDVDDTEQSTSTATLDGRCHGDDNFTQLPSLVKSIA